MGDGAGGNVVEGARQPTLPHRRGNVRQRRRDRWWRQARLLAAGLYGLPHLLEEGRWTIINDVGHVRKKNRKKDNQTEKEKKNVKTKEKCEKEETEIKVRYSDISTGNNTKKKNSKEKQKEKCKNGKHKIIQHLRQKVADTMLDKRKTGKQTKNANIKAINVKR